MKKTPFPYQKNDEPLFWWLWALLAAAMILSVATPREAHAADSYTTNLRIVQQVPGTNASTWGTKANSAFAMLDEAISKVTTVSVTGGDVTLTTANNSTDQARSAVIVFSGSPGTPRTATAPNVQKVYYLYNNSDSTVVFRAGSGSTLSLPSLSKATVYADGSNNVVVLYNVSAFAATVLDDVNAAAVLTTLGVSAFAQSVLDDVDAATARTTLGLGTLATQSGTFAGTHSGASSGTNTGDQTITLTGDVTGSGTGSFATTLINTLTGKILSGSTLSGNTVLPNSGLLDSSGNLGLGMTPSTILDVTQSQNAASSIRLLNSSTGPSALSRVVMGNGNGVFQMQSGVFGNGYTPSGLSRADGAYMYSAGAGGLTIATLVDQPIYFGVNSVEVAEMTSAGLVISGKATFQNNVRLSYTPASLNDDEAGFRGVPRNVQQNGYNFVLSDAGKMVYHSDGNSYSWGVPSNADVPFPIGTKIELVNNSAEVVFIIRGSPVTVIIHGTGAGGNHTLPAFSVSYLVKIDVDDWILSGDAG